MPDIKNPSAAVSPAFDKTSSSSTKPAQAESLANKQLPVAGVGTSGSKSSQFKVAPTVPRTKTITTTKISETVDSKPTDKTAKKKKKTAPKLSPKDLRFPKEHFLNRGLSWLQFNRRVFAQAQDKTIPLLERLRFLCIASSNMDEFFEIRVAGLKEQVKAHVSSREFDGLSVEEVFQKIQIEAHAQIKNQYDLFNNIMLPSLAKEGIVFLRRAGWNAAQRAWIKDYFFKSVMPVLTPIALDPAHPFPLMVNKSLNFVVQLEGKDGFGRNLNLAVVQAPRILPRFIALPTSLQVAPYTFVFLSSIVHDNVSELFPGIKVHGSHQFRVTRNSDLFLDEEEVKNLRLSLQGELPQRHYGDAVRLEISDECPEHMVDFLLGQFSLSKADLYRVKGPVNLVRLMGLPDMAPIPSLLFPPFTPALPKRLRKRTDIFLAIRKNDILLHHPYQSFVPVIEFINLAAEDPQVLSIKMTIYRTGNDSKLMESLVEAARRGKEVTVVVELMARFDEEANINWANRLEAAGAHVVYGVFGFKTHAKMLLLVRREENGLRLYAHLGTGNYHPRTARMYTDFGLLTACESICRDVQDIFKQLTGLCAAPKLRQLWQSPFNLHENLLVAINNEASAAAKKKPARIIAKMNALLDPQIIEVLYSASQAGVQIDLIVRGMCTLRPGIKGLSENIRVCSAIGRFLEHSRVFYFLAGGEELIYLASADWMERNFFRRVEACFPVLSERLKKRIYKEALKPFIDPKAQVWVLNSEGVYELRGLPFHHPQSVMLSQKGNF